MLNLKKFFSLILGFFIFTSAHATPSDDLTKLLLDINTMQADFTQTVKDKSRSLQQSQGHMSLERPGKFRWEIKRPTPQLIIANGAKLWIYDADLEQVTVRTFKKAAGQTPALLLSDKSLTLSKDFNVQTNNGTSDSKALFLLTPKDKEDPFATIKLTFINKQIREMRLEDRLGHITTIAFQNVKTGNTLPSSLFVFKPTANIDVIDETKTRR